MRSYVLPVDIRSIVNPEHVYARKGEQVTEVAKYGHVSIVESNSGRFSVTEKQLTGEEEITVVIKGPSAKQKKKGKVVVVENSLF